MWAPGRQLLDTGFFHADPHPGNLIRTPDGRLAILDFGLVTVIDENIKVCHERRHLTCLL